MFRAMKKKKENETENKFKREIMNANLLIYFFPLSSFTA